MGNAETRFHQLLLSGDLEQAVRSWQENPELQSGLNLRTPVRYSKQRDPPLHCILRIGNYRQPPLKVLVYEFLSNRADPLEQNANNETAIHVVCCSQRHSARENRARREILEMLLERLPHIPQPGEDVNKVPAKGVRNHVTHLSIGDKSRNTPLHLAAASGLLDCVELLLACGAPLFAQNVAKQTPLDSAAAAKQIVIAPILESQMVLSKEKKDNKTDQSKSFYTPEQLKQVQADIVDSVSFTYQISSDTARALLSAFSWSKHLLDEAWSRNKEEACAQAGLDINDLAPPTNSDREFHSLMEKLCEICYEAIPPGDIVEVPCGHNFCRQCWASYLELAVREGGGKDIPCPGHECSRPVPMSVIAKLVSEELYRKYSDLSLQHFVDTNQEFKWCPYPNCNQAVIKKEERWSGASELGGRHGINVECGNGHGFCWNCLKDAHEPCECEVWEKWLEVITKMVHEGDVDYNKVAQQAEADARWIIDNTKPCPRCSAPIQKNEGCNHMTCKKCRYDFCWVCLDPWGSHSYRTGGYFSCNRYAAQRRAQSRVEETRRNLTDMYRKSATEDKKAQSDKFSFYHTRYKSHLLSIQIESKMLVESQAKTRSLMKMRKVVQKKVGNLRSEKQPDLKIEDTENFLEGILRVLLHARRLLATSYGIGFLIPDERKEVKNAHETIQGKLEEVVEILAQMVSRPYLNTPQADMAEKSRDVEFIHEELMEMLREVLVKGLEKEAPPPRPKPSRERTDTMEEVVFEVDPLILFAHLAMRHDPQFREIFNQLLAEQEGDEPPQQLQQ